MKSGYRWLGLLCLWGTQVQAQVTTPFSVEVINPAARCSVISPTTICFQYTRPSAPGQAGSFGLGQTTLRIRGPAQTLGGIDLKVVSPLVTATELPWIKLVRSGTPEREFPSPFGDLPVDVGLELDAGRVQELNSGRFIAYVLITFENAPSFKLPIQLTVGPDSDSVRADPDFITAFTVVPMSTTTPLKLTLTLKRLGNGPLVFLNASTDTSDGGNWLSADMRWYASGCAEYPVPCQVFGIIDPPSVPGDYWGVWAFSAGGYGDRVTTRFRVNPGAGANPTTVEPREVTASAESGSSKPFTAAVVISGGGYDGTPIKVLHSEPWLDVDPAISTWPTTLTLTMKPSGLAPGTYTDLVRIRGAESNEALASIPVTFNVVAPSYVPFMLDGGGWRTTVYLVNPSRQPAKATLRFWTANTAGAAASPWLVDLAGGRGLKAQIENETIPPLGLRVVETVGAQSRSQTGWAELAANAPVAMHAVLSEARTSGGRPPEATVPMTNPFRDAVLLPFDQLNGASVSVSLANPDDQPITVSVVALNEDGVEMAREGRFTIGARGAATFPIAEKWTSTAKRRGLAALTFDGGRLFVTGLRTSGSGFYSYPAVARGLIGIDRGIPHVAAGGPWQSTVYLANASPLAQSGSFRLWPEAGGLADEAARPAPANGILVWQPSPNDPARAHRGWLESRYPKQVTGFLLLRQSLAASTAVSRFETGFASEAGTVGKIAVPFDNRDGNSTRIAIVNPSDAPIEIQLVTYDLAGRFPRFGEIFRLAPKGQLVVDTVERLDLGGQQGILEFSNRQGSPLTGIGLRFGDGPVTVLPAYEK